ncbi:hypothetical protein OE88DRAFT_1682773 [Heliocybe sulcata]|uniref:RING-type domain-containing protein n=1 Tax=Heliocybe sulcata TaxID=5364 RepID=A0A5C3MXY6_9AGAM|nr:hypothetical protein OE88DRAFT_1682773 [Heliocybe sulcata]
MATTHNYVGIVDANLICCICRSPFIEPTTTRTCAHTFCYDCILHSIRITPQCPVDRSPLVPGDLAPADPVVRNLVDELSVECPERDAGCTYTGQRQLLASHLKESCRYTRVPCEADECDAMILRKGQGHHRHDSKDVPGRDDFSETAEPASAPAQSSSRSSTSEANARLSEENTLLKTRVEALEGLVRILTKEMQAVKTALGPWVRPESHSASSSMSPLSYFDHRHVSGQVYSPSTQTEQSNPFDFPTLSEDYHSRAPPSVSEAPQDYYTNIDQPSVPRLPAPWPLNDPATPETYAYLSALTSNMYPSNAFTTDPHPSPPHTHAPLPPQPQSSPSNAPASYPNPIAPLNLSTTVFGALSGLHESIVSVSTNVDSLARRTEITMNTDRAMMSEEMRVVKAAVHGLRMQVHAIMMDRNAQVTGRTSGPTQASLDHPQEEGHVPGWPPLLQHLNYLRPFPPPSHPTSIPKL